MNRESIMDPNLERFGYQGITRVASGFPARTSRRYESARSRISFPEQPQAARQRQRGRRRENRTARIGFHGFEQLLDDSSHENASQNFQRRGRRSENNAHNSRAFR